MTRALRAAFPSIALLGWIVFVATLAHGDVKKHDDAVDWWPGRGRIGPERCGNADSRQGGNADGTWAYFKDAQATCPMVCTGTPTSDGTGPGAWCVHERGQWDCCSSIGATCSGCDPDPCQNGGTCVPTCNGTAICLCPCGFTGDQCATPTPTTTTTTLPPGDICIPDPAVPVEQRALRTVATTGTCEDNWLPYCDVRNYGATGDGITDDTAAFAAAITACCNSGVVYAPHGIYKTTALLNPGATCRFSLMGQGQFGSEIDLVGSFSSCAPSADAPPPAPCDAFLDLGGGDIHDLTLVGPGSFLLPVGTDDAGVNGVQGAAHIDRVTIQQFTTAALADGDAQAPVLRDVTFRFDYVGYRGLAAPGVPTAILENILCRQGMFACLLEPGAVVHLSDSKLQQTPYLIHEGETGGGIWTFLFERNDFGLFGNAGIYQPTTDMANWFVISQSAVDPTFKNENPTFGVQNNAFKLGTVAVDHALHVKDTKARSTFFIGRCDQMADWEFGTITESVQVTQGNREASIGGMRITDCIPTTGGGTPERIVICSENQQQCQPIVFPSVTFTGSGTSTETINIMSNARGYFVTDGSASTATQLRSTDILNPCESYGQQVTLLFTNANTTLKHNSGVVACFRMFLNGSVDWNPPTGSTITFLNDGTLWREVARMTAGTTTTTTTTSTTTTT